MRIARVFPKRTNMSPMDVDCYFAEPTMFTPKYDEVHISVVFSSDMARAEYLAGQWQDHGTVRIGGPACGDIGGEFDPGRYIAPGAVFTSRGCPRACPWCYVPKREGRKIRYLEIHAGNILQDNNFLACDKAHREKVYAMLRVQRQVSLRGGLDARLLRDSDIEAIRGLRLSDLWTAYDDKENKIASLSAIRRLRTAGIPQSKIRCYVLIGFGNETRQQAEDRLRDCFEAGALPFAQLYDGYKGGDLKEWKQLSRKWSRPAIYKSIIKG